MRMIDFEKKRSLKAVALYLTVREAENMRNELERLLEDPEAKEHFHVCDKDMSREISCSLITESRLKNLSGYSRLERQILSDARP